MKFRPCIDIHNGKVKQIVGGTLKDQNDQAAENFVSEQDLSLIHIWDSLYMQIRWSIPTCIPGSTKPLTEQMLTKRTALP